MNQPEINTEDDVIPSRDDMTSQLITDMKEEKKNKLSTIEEESNVDIINEFENAIKIEENKTLLLI